MTASVDNLLSIAIQAAVLVLVGGPLPRLFGLRSPRARLAYWQALLCACLLLPLIQPWLPDPAAPVRVTALSERADAVPGAVTPRAVAGFGLPGIGLRDVLAIGALGRLAWFALGVATLARLRRRAVPLEPRPPSVETAIVLAGASADFRVAARATRPVTFGLLRPVVVVPSDFGEFGADQQQAIACHELTHVRRRDWARTVADEILRAVAWFHPAAWWLTRQIRLAREQVVDQEVVRLTGSRKAYLDALLRLASPERGSILAPAPLFLGRSPLSDRISLLLKEVRMSRPRLALSFVAMATVLLVAGRAAVAAFPLHGAALRTDSSLQAVGSSPPASQQPARDRATVPEWMPGAAKLKDVRPAFPAGAPAVPVFVRAAVDGSGVVREAAPAGGPTALGELAAAAVKQWRFAAGGPARSILVGFNPSASADLGDQPAVRTGKLRPPVKVRDVKPVYPEEALQKKVEGVVVLEVRLAPDGTVSDAWTLKSIPLLDASAIEAVLGWKFSAPGFPLEVTVTINFAPHDGPAKGVPGGVGHGVGSGAGVGVPGGVGPAKVGGTAQAGAGASTGKAVRIGGDVKPPLKVVDVKPVYPSDARDARVQGAVILEASIGPDGKVQGARVVQSIPQLDDAALDAVKQWEFEPTIIDGKRVTVIMTVTVNFVLK